MSKISTNGIIQLNRGDSLSFLVLVNLGNDLVPQIHKLNQQDSIYFGVMEPNQPFENALIRKKLTEHPQNEDGYINIDLIPQDTLNLLPGKYYYQIKLETSNKDVFTFVDKKLFIILE